MNLISHIIQILENEHVITLPSLGKFQLTFNSVTIDNTTKKIFPPYYSIVFSQQYDIKNETIFRKISSLESIEENQVREEYGLILSQWKDILKDKKQLFLECFGVFTSDKEKISFKMFENCIVNFKNFGLPVI